MVVPMVRKGTFVVRMDALDDFKNEISKMRFQKCKFKNASSKTQFQKCDYKSADQVIASMIAVCEFTWRRRKLAVDEEVRCVHI